MLIAVPANAVLFSSRRWQPPARAHPHNGTCGLVERQRGAGLVSINRQNAKAAPSVVPSHATSLRVEVSSTAGSLQALSHSIRRARLPYVRVTVAQRLVMGKGFFARHKHPYTGVFSKSLTASDAGLPAAAVPVPPASDDPAQCHCAPVTLWCSCQNAAGRFHGHTGGLASTRACSSRP